MHRKVERLAFDNLARRGLRLERLLVYDVNVASIVFRAHKRRLAQVTLYPGCVAFMFFPQVTSERACFGEGFLTVQTRHDKRHSKGELDDVVACNATADVNHYQTWTF